MAADEKGPYSRAQLCRKYGVTERTLRALEKSGLLQLTWQVEHGLMVALLSNVGQRRVLAASKNHVSTYGRDGGIERVPFQRFLFLRFLQLPLADIYVELVERNLVHPRGFSIDRLKKMHKAFIDSVPQPLRKCVAARKPPKTVTEKRQFDVLLQVCEIDNAYAHPELEQAFSCMTDGDVKLGIDLGLVTQSTLPEICAFLEDSVSFSIPAAGLLFYHITFMDISFMSNDEVQSYLKTQKPSSRNMLAQALGRPIADMRLIIGLDAETDTDHALATLRGQATQQLLASMMLPQTSETRRDAHLAMKNLMMLVDREDRTKIAADRGAGGIKLPDVFRQLELKTSTMEGGLFRLPGPEVDEQHG